MAQGYDVAIVGAGHAGAQAAIALRQLGFAGTLALIGDEREPPYERPPLSKDYLAGERPFERMLIRPEAFWAERQIDLLTGARVAAVDPMARALRLADDSELGYGTLIWAAGGSPRMLDCPGASARNLFPVRRRRDADAIRAALPEARRVAIVGGGYIGLETAAVLRTLGAQVTLLEAQPRLLSRVSGEAVAHFYEQQHRARGVDIRLNAAVERIETDAQGRANAITLTDGERIATDLIVVGIGIVAEVGALLAAGASGGNGVDVDAHCRTSLEHVYAIGDCAAHASRFAGGAMIRLESVQNAHDMAKVAARNILGEDAEYGATPWFWSNQYDLKLQTVGLAAGHDATVLRGDPASGAFTCAYLKEGRLIALDCVNRTKDYAQGRALIEEGAMPDRAALADADVPLKEVERG